jgi:hypothetical protein
VLEMSEALPADQARRFREEMARSVLGLTAAGSPSGRGRSTP